MNEIHLSKRLSKVAGFVPKGAGLADIGSDHAYLPANLVKNGLVDHAVAGEVIRGPFLSAKNLVEKLQLTDKVAVRLADGLDAIMAADQISVITICGMGGQLICDILGRGSVGQRLTGKERLILQPNVGESKVRQWLMENFYKIHAEAILEEDHKIYEIIVAEKAADPINYSPKELLFGPCLLTEKNSVFIKKWQQEIHQREKILKKLAEAATSQAGKIARITEEIDEIEEMLKDERMGNKTY